ncbi:uncharacterized protein B0J16DRAFT_17443 [Fusarium flagelliforme]|nr:uncharacterized protein B0J16DRAFT_17443 [Fusarium flagelliforme]KAH7197341.1 hypothetical protein B0J16DRAFT_17443 [Fusarium flagelliforme]
MPKTAKTAKTRRVAPIRTVTTRRAPPSPPASQNTNTTLATSSTRIAVPVSGPASAATSHADNEGSKLSKQADALARMSFQVNLNAVSKIAYALQDDVKKLVLQTADNHGYRRENEERMTRMMLEVQTIKQFMASLKDAPPAMQADIERTQEEMRKTVKDWHAKFDGIETQVEAISNAAKQPPKPVTTKAVNPGPFTPDTLGRETRSAKKARIEADVSAKEQQSSELANSSNLSTPEGRIHEAINSTKRWNREHKVTKLKDNQYIVSYFRKQTQRDPQLASILQRTFQNRVVKNVEGEANPRGLEECSNYASWNDVTDTAAKVLIANEKKLIELLQRR